MRKTFCISFIVAIFLVSFLGVRTVYAVENVPDLVVWSDLMLEAFAIETGKTVSQIQAYRDDGMTYREIALELGYTGEDFTDLFERVEETVLELAVDEELITQEDSDQLSRRIELIHRISAWILGKFLERLGLTQEDVVAMLNDGMTLREIFSLQSGENRGESATICGISYQEYIARIRSGESPSEICPNLMPANFEWRSIFP